MLQWSLQYGEAYRAAAIAGTDWTGPERPDFIPGVEPWYDDFWELSTDRQIGTVAGPIPNSVISRHTSGWPNDDAEMFRACIRRMDGFYMTFKPSKAQNVKLEGLSPQDRLSAIFGDRIK